LKSRVAELEKLLQKSSQGTTDTVVP